MPRRDHIWTEVRLSGFRPVRFPKHVRGRIGHDPICREAPARSACYYFRLPFQPTPRAPPSYSRSFVPSRVVCCLCYGVPLPNSASASKIIHLASNSIDAEARNQDHLTQRALCHTRSKFVTLAGTSSVGLKDARSLQDSHRHAGLGSCACAPHSVQELKPPGYRVTCQPTSTNNRTFPTKLATTPDFLHAQATSNEPQIQNALEPCSLLSELRIRLSFCLGLAASRGSGAGALDSDREALGNAGSASTEAAKPQVR